MTTPLVDPPFSKADLLSLPSEGDLLNRSCPFTARYLAWTSTYRDAVLGSESVEKRLAFFPKADWPLPPSAAANLLQDHFVLARRSLADVEKFIVLLITVVKWFGIEDIKKNADLDVVLIWSWCEVQHALLKVAFRCAGLDFPFGVSPAMMFEDGSIRERAASE